MIDRDAAIDAMIGSASTVLGIEVRPEWRLAVKANLEVSLKFWSRLAEIDLPVDSEPAPQFDAFAGAPEAGPRHER